MGTVGAGTVELESIASGEWLAGNERTHVVIAPGPGSPARLVAHGADVAIEADVGGGLVMFLPASAPWRIIVPEVSVAIPAITIPAGLVLEICGASAAPWRRAISERQVRIADAAVWLAGGRSGEATGRELVSLLLVRLVATSFGTFARRADDSWLPAAALARIASLGAPPAAVRDLSVPALAAVAGLGLSAFSRAFRGSTGLTPGEYLIRVRMDHVASLLAGTDLPVAAIAERTGLAGVAHLTEQFRQRFGVTPGRYRAALRSERSSRSAG